MRRAVMQRPVWQALALQDLAQLSQGGPSEQWRRAAIFDDESGQSWSTVVQHCLGEVCSRSGCEVFIEHSVIAPGPSTAGCAWHQCMHMVSPLLLHSCVLYADRVAGELQSVDVWRS